MCTRSEAATTPPTHQVRTPSCIRTQKPAHCSIDAICWSTCREVDPVVGIRRVVQREPRRVLLVDKHEPSRTAVAIALSLRGHTCMHVENMAEALETIRSFHPDAIAYDTTSASPHPLREAAARFVPTVVVIALATLEATEHPSLVDGVLVKPIDLLQLEQLLCGGTIHVETK